MQLAILRLTCELGFVYFLSDLAVWTANPQALNNPNLFLKGLCTPPPSQNLAI